MHETEPCGCGCGQEHHTYTPLEGLTEAQSNFLHHLEHHHFLPVARFVLESSLESDFSSVALAPVYLRANDEEMATVKETGAMLQALEDAGYLTLDYDVPLDGYAYKEYHESALYAYFCQTIAEAKGRPGFLGDTPRLELGSIAPATPPQA